MRKSVSSPGPHSRHMAHNRSYGMAARYRSPWPDTHGGGTPVQWETANLGRVGTGNRRPHLGGSGWAPGRPV